MSDSLISSGVEPPAPVPSATAVVARAQRRTLQTLFIAQIVGGVGVAVGYSVGALLAADLVGIGASGLAQSAGVVGGALIAIPATRVVRQHGRRPSLSGAYLVAAVGSFVILGAAIASSVWLLFAGLFLFGGGTTASLQARYAAIDLAPPAVRGRHLSIVVWATTVGSVAGPNLARPTGVLLTPYGIPTLAAPFVLSGFLFFLVAAVIFAMLRPDPVVVARSVGANASDADGKNRSLGMMVAMREIARRPDATLGVTSTAVGHLVMVGVMSMTPVHILGAGHTADETLRIVGIVLSLHIAGMFAFAPLTGWLTDRVGRRTIILAGVALLLLACAVAGSAGHGTPQLAVGLWILGLGWSCTMVAGSTLLSDAIPTELRPSSQGFSDLAMGLAAAAAGAMAGLIVQAWGYPILTLVASLATIPLIFMAVRRPNRPALQEGAA